MHRCHRIKEASSEPAEASIAETGVRLLLQQTQPIEIFLFDQLLGDGIEQKILNIIGERSAEKKFYRQIIDAFWIPALIRLLGTDPTLRKYVAYGSCNRFKPIARVGNLYVRDTVEKKMALI